MARIRSIKPDAFISDTLSGVSRGARWTFAGLWTYLDDEGRGRADVRLITAALYAMDDSTGVDDVRSDMAELDQIEAVCHYEVDGKKYVHAPNWELHQRVSRPTPSRIPHCPLHESSMNPIEDSLKPNEASVPEVEVEKEREVEQGSRKAANAAPTPINAPPVFAEFCDTYPGNVSTKPALAAWTAAVKRTNGHPQLILNGAREYRDWVIATGTNGKYIRGAVKWLNEDGWLDKLKPVARAGPKSTTDERFMDAATLAEQLRAEEAQATGIHRKALEA